ncbi:MAG: 30S ribosomal protein S1 [Dehalococcoidia bacterium]
MAPETQDDFPQDMQSWIDSMEFTQLRRGDIVEGSVMRVDPDGIFVDVGQKIEGYVPANEMRSMPQDEFQALKEGDPLITFVVKPESDEGPLLSIDKARGEEGWRELQRYQEEDQAIEGTIVGFNRGGCILDVANVQGFVPMSQLLTISRDVFQLESEDGSNDARQQQKNLVGTSLTVKVLEVNRARNRAIFSERSALQKQRDQQKAELIQVIQEGDVRQGVVTGISNFGAFVDLGGADGLIHISEMSWSMVQSPADVVKVGEKIDVFILKVDKEALKIALSLRRLSPKPWETIDERYSVGDVVSAIVTKLANFGAFAKLEDTIEGLIHLTELSISPIEHPSEIIKEGDQIQVKILKIEPDRKRLGLSLIQADTPDVIVDPDSIDLDAQYENVDNEIGFDYTQSPDKNTAPIKEQDEIVAEEQDEIVAEEQDEIVAEEQDEIVAESEGADEGEDDGEDAGEDDGEDDGEDEGEDTTSENVDN